MSSRINEMLSNGEELMLQDREFVITTFKNNEQKVLNVRYCVSNMIAIKNKVIVCAFGRGGYGYGNLIA